MIIRKLRLQRGWTQEHLASLTGLSVRSIQRIERGRPVSLETRNALAAVFELDRSIFQPGETDMSQSPALDPEEADAIQYVKGLKEFYQHLALYLILTPVFALAWGMDMRFLGTSIGWGIGVVVHGLQAFEVVRFSAEKWEKQQVEKRLGRPLA
ncbi:MAG: helix-turn-helix domain-containing protein [Lysobacteraceae bacterium]